MNLADIPAIRKQFKPLRDRYRAAWKCTDPYNETSFAKWTDEFRKIRVDEGALCKKYFGHDLYIDGEYLDPTTVLDWVEHFMRAEK